MKSLPLLSLLAFTALALPALGQQAMTPVVGVNSVVCPSGSDTYVAVSFNRPTAFLGVVAASGVQTVSAQGAISWTTDQFVAPQAHFVKFITGAKAGAFYEVTGNTGDTLTLGLDGDSLAGVAAGDQIAVIPYWTLADLFPVGNATIHQSTGTTVFARRTQVLFPNLSGSGINMAPSAQYYLTSDGWRDPMNGNVLVNPRVEPDQFVIIRHRSQDPGTTYYTAGAVETWTVRSILATLPGGQVDNPVTNLRSVPVKLKNLGLAGTPAFVGSAGTSTFVRKDVLYVYDNTVQAINKIPAHIYYYNTLTGQWLDGLEANRVADDDLILPATGYIIRKSASADGASSLWTHNLVTD